MQNLNLIFLVSVVLCACASQNTEREHWKKIYQAMDAGTVQDVKKIVGDSDIEKESHLFNFLSKTCTPKKDADYLEKADYLLSKGVRVQEMELMDKSLGATSEKIPAPLLTSIEHACYRLTNLYLNALSPNVIAQASGKFEAQTRDDLITPAETISYEAADDMLKYYIENLSFLIQGIGSAAFKNDLYCLQGNDENCGARNHLKLQESKIVTEVVYALGIKYCKTVQLQREEKDLMQAQVELGKETGEASPAIYDEHAQSAQYLKDKQNEYKRMMKHYFNVSLRPESCLR